MTDSKLRFSDRVENYVRYRPDYPAELVDALIELCQLNASSAIADIGSGTGCFSHRLLSKGLSVTAVEPNKEMRAAAEAQLSHFEGFNSVDGSAEQSSLQDASVDFIVAAQAFHWFRFAETLREFIRILKPTGSVALVWNQRKLQSPFQSDYDVMLRQHAPEYSSANHMNISDEAIPQFYDRRSFQIRDFENSQNFDLSGFIGRMQSSSYTPAKGLPGHDALVTAATELFRQHEVDGRIRFEYNTRLYFGKLNT
ncbi:MAG: ubiquinone/menaquinone biosynthesis C-methylase UbiE [Gammaproteobacteria bacterium]|jgi:ubiquinone/menaquinone biosynthesis C-methylase UbiE